MLKSYITVAWRNFWKNKVFSLINLLGLAIGISAALVIYLIVSHDLSFDKFHKDGDRIYRVVSDMRFPGQDFKNSGVPAPLPDAARKELTGVETVAAFHLFNYDVKVNIPSARGKAAEYKKEDNIIFTDDNYFKLIPYKWLAGSPEVMTQPYKLVLTKSRAEKYFGKTSDPSKWVGQPVHFNDTIITTVAGIVNDLEETTDFTFREFISLATAHNNKGLSESFGFTEWGSINSSSQLMVKLAKGTKPDQVNRQFASIRKKNTKPSPDTDVKHRLQPLSDIHFNGDYDNFDQRQAHLPTLYGLSLVAVFLLMLGCINFINLTTAQAAQRAKEIGIRKTMGGSKKQLVLQFLSETFLTTLLATMLSVAITPGILEIFSDFIPAELSFQPFQEPRVIMFLVLLVVLVGILSGFYPALVLSRFRPVTVLKNQAFAGTAKTRSFWIRKTFTVSQFVIAQVFIMATIVVSKQVSFSLNKELGFKKDAIVYFSIPWREHPDKGRVLHQQLQSVPGIQMISLAGTPPASPSTGSQTMKFMDGNKEIESTVEVKNADSNYFRLYQMKLAAGRTFVLSDTETEYVVNETFARSMGFKDPAEIVGKFIKRNDKLVPIVGVLRDFHTKSTHVPIKPLAFSMNKHNNAVFSIALQPGTGESWQSTLKQVEALWKQTYPEHDFDYKFFDESIAAFYDSERNMARLLMWATGLAIFISCLGLLGLVIYTTHQRVKEIGIRKVLGASVAQIVSLLSTDFVKLVLLAFVLAVPLTWLGMYKWLENFAYRTDLSWWIFLLGGGIMLIIAVITLSIQTIRSAMANPADNLRTE
ncbi:MAG TPA: ABC transporter permease [Chitinophagaceae bacterium]|nr:ABC transporter permease [Chitinophagaceae bacterium]